MDGIDRQNKEFDALNELIKRWESLQRVAVVDDDYPEYRHYYETALKNFVGAIENNGRLKVNLSFDYLRGVNVRRCVDGFKHALESWSVAEWTNAVAGEAGEAANVAKKMLRFRDNINGTYRLQTMKLWTVSDQIYASSYRSLAVLA